MFVARHVNIFSICLRETNTHPEVLVGAKTGAFMIAVGAAAAGKSDLALAAYLVFHSGSSLSI